MAEIIIKDTLRAEVEAASGGKQTVLYTAKGQPSYFNVIPQIRLEDLHPSLGSGIHPAFLVGGVEKSEIFIGTYQAVIRDGEALSLPGEVPAGRIDFDAARAVCGAAGPGFHLMTNWEWAAIALQCAAMGIDMRGNTNYGQSRSHPDERGQAAGRGYITLAGSGPDAWRHDGTPFGIADLVGNVWEWVDGLKLVSGRVMMPADNDFCLVEGQWPDAGAAIDIRDGEPMISSSAIEDGWNGCEFSGLRTERGFSVPPSLMQAALCPVEGMMQRGWLWVDASDGFEALPIRGGSWGRGANAGSFALTLNYGRSYVLTFIGFRPAFVL
ncbi:SUMF1/EgtB/PvdO family nonheme iron enzyme [Geoalkalibacter halelectricus]|uniref:SUMF1/EgtB/PvdO family nonheme iron enzyme n=1 Tax=Geoalkalibacter halelectricus TaxID=2847045 RepID=UPI003D1FD12B